MKSSVGISKRTAANMLTSRPKVKVVQNTPARYAAIDFVNRRLGLLTANTDRRPNQGKVDEA